MAVVADLLVHSGGHCSEEQADAKERSTRFYSKLQSVQVTARTNSIEGEFWLEKASTGISTTRHKMSPWGGAKQGDALVWESTHFKPRHRILQRAVLPICLLTCLDVAFPEDCFDKSTEYLLVV